MVEKRKLPWGMLAALLVGLLVISYFLSGLTTLDGVTLANWQDKLLYVILHPLQNWWNDLTFTFLGIALIVWIGIVTYLMDYYRNRQIGVEYGSEQWADIKQIQRILTNKDETKNTLLSQNVAVDNGKLSPGERRGRSASPHRGPRGPWPDSWNPASASDHRRS